MRGRRMRFFVLYFVLLFCPVTFVQAQDPIPPYRLVEPMADDTIEVAARLIEGTANTEGEARLEYSSALDALNDEINGRTLDRLTYDQLLALFLTYAEGTPPAFSDRTQTWIPLLIEKWLAENETDLSTVLSLEFDGFVFDVRRIYYGNVFSLELRGAPFAYDSLFEKWVSPRLGEGFIVFDIDRHDYQVPRLPVPMSGRPIASADFNADGQQDFAYLTYSHEGNGYVSGALQVMTWTETTLESLSSIHFSHGPPDRDYNLTWAFTHLDETSDLELIQTQDLYDSYGCHFVRVTYYDWQENGSLLQNSQRDTFPQSFSCFFRRAEQFAWAYDYEAAVVLYDQAFAQLRASGRSEPYFQMRLALAHLLNGENVVSFSTLSIATNEPERHEWVAEILDAYTRDPRSLPVCQAIYDRALDILYDMNVAGSSNITGSIEVSDGGFYGYGPGFYQPWVNLNALSCDLDALIKSQLSQHPFATSETPTEQLEALGLRISDHFVADLDADGEVEWIVWIASPQIDPLVFISNGSVYDMTIMEGLGSSNYQTQSADMRPPAENNQYTTTTLPDGTAAIMNVDFGFDEMSQILCQWAGCGGGIFPYCPNEGLGDVSLWRLQNGQFTRAFYELICESVRNQSLFPDGEGGRTILAGQGYWPLQGDDRYTQIRITLYVWDDTLRTFVAPPVPTITPSLETPVPTEIPTQENEYPLSGSTFFYLRYAFVEGNFASALEIANAAFEGEPAEPSFFPAFRYYRALTLEALGRPDEALAEYITLYESVPESPWGVLARLHLAS